MVSLKESSNQGRSILEVKPSRVVDLADGRRLKQTTSVSCNKEQEYKFGQQMIIFIHMFKVTSRAKCDDYLANLIKSSHNHIASYHNFEVLGLHFINTKLHHLKSQINLYSHSVMSTWPGTLPGLIS